MVPRPPLTYTGLKFLVSANELFTGAIGGEHYCLPPVIWSMWCDLVFVRLHTAAFI